MKRVASVQVTADNLTAMVKKANDLELAAWRTGTALRCRRAAGAVIRAHKRAMLYRWLLREIERELKSRKEARVS